MAPTAPLLRPSATTAASPTITTVKQLAESANVSSIPSKYAHNAETEASEPGDSIPIIDLSLLASGNARAIHDLDSACRQWGFFMVVNHGIPQELINGVLEATREFFDLSEEEKPEFQPKDVLTPVRYGTSFNTEKEDKFCWRDFLKVFVHPEFNCPDRPLSLRYTNSDILIS